MQTVFSGNLKDLIDLIDKGIATIFSIEKISLLTRFFYFQAA